MTRTRALLGLLVLAAVGIAVALLVVPGDGSSDGGSAPRRATTSTAATTSRPASTTAPGPTTTPPTTAATPPGPCGSVQGAITTAVDAGVAGAGTGATITECRLAASDTTWALARLEPRAGSSFAATTVVLRQSAGTWSVVATGGTAAGCGVAPQQVIADLGQFCVGTGGGAQ